MTASARVGWAILVSALGILALERPASATGFEASGNVERGGGIILDSYSNVFTGLAQFDNTAVLQTDQSIHLEADSFSSGPGQHAHSFAGWTHQIGTPTDPDAFATFLAQSSAHATFSDFVITPPAGATGPVLTSFNVHMDGSLIAGSFFTPSGASTAQSDVQFLLFGPESLTSRNVGAGSLTLRGNNGTPVMGFGTGLLANLATAPSIAFLGNVAFSSVFSSNAFLAPVGVPFTVELFLVTEAFVTNDFVESFITAANSDFAGTLTFATDRPVFNLPSGFTVNSVDARIIDNTFSPSSSPVPEPTTVGLLSLGLAILGLRRRLRVPRRRTGLRRI